MTYKIHQQSDKEWNSSTVKKIAEKLEFPGMLLATNPKPYWAVDVILPQFVSYFLKENKKIIAFDEVFEDQTSPMISVPTILRVIYNADTFVDDIKRVMSASPEIILFPMIRDVQVAEAALRYARVGLALCGMHTQNAEQANQRFIDMGCQPSDIDSARIQYIERK